MTYARDVAALARKDLLLELRARETLPAMVLFVLSTLVAFRFALPGGGSALRFNAHEYVGFDAFILERPGAGDGVPPELLARAKAWAEGASQGQKDTLLASIMAGLPGAYERYDVAGLRRILAAYGEMTAQDLKKLDVIDRIIPEPMGGAQRAPAETIAAVGDAIAEMLAELDGMKPADIVRDRRQKFLAMGSKALA